MTKDVVLSINGIQMAAEDDDTIDVITPGKYYNKNGMHYVIYEEVDEDTLKSTQNVIKVGEYSIEIKKIGFVNSSLVFESGRENLSCYETPYGELMVGILANEVLVKAEENFIDVDIDYSLKINGEYVSDCKINMNIRAV
ncbi:MAG: DUF1934 domain-containing protein [Eubacterium sp.]